VRLWIDTDVGDDPDDAIALLCAKAHAAVELVGVSTVDGDLDRRVRIARTLVDVPVYRGDDPDLGSAVTAAAPDLILAIGPLTNLATLLAAGESLPPVVLMGGLLGTVRHWGVTLQVEHNFSRDPAAAARVLTGCAPALVAPLDVTVSTRLTAEALARLLALAPVLESPVQAFLDLQRELGVPAGEGGVFLHDPLALLAAVEPSVVRVEELTLAVEPDGRLIKAVDGSTTRVARAVDGSLVTEQVLGLLAPSAG
jgi:inosine-uridine nucleoside N-ribohydrolase